jgi:hypothetical protein
MQGEVRGSQNRQHDGWRSVNQDLEFLHETKDVIRLNNE